MCKELTKTWWYKDGDCVFKHTFSVSLLCGLRRKLARKKSIKRSMSCDKNGVPREKGLSALNSNIFRSAMTLWTNEKMTLFESRMLM